MICERCGKDIPDSAAICPSCGTVTQIAQPPINATVVNNFPAASSNKNGAALITEIILSLFSIYGVGWLMAGETTIGVILLVSSFVIFWPLLITIASVTFGLGVCFCNLPLAITGIIINAMLLNNTLNRKALPLPFSTV
jgi:hypothetical protein